jgi:hypothetical protein
VRLRCLVDNSVRPSSPYWGEHGLSFLVEGDDDGASCSTPEPGAAAFVALSRAFEGRVFHCPSGTTVELQRP